jgi:hypothetical protein
MPFLTQGKTNWKYIIIIVILAVIVGGGILGYFQWNKRETQFAQLPEIKKLEESCKKLSGIDKDRCYLNLAQEELKPEFCKKIELGNISDECNKSFEIATELQNLNPIPINIANSDEELRKYLIENLVSLIDIDGKLYGKDNSEQFCRFNFIRENFDIDPNREIIVVFECGPGPAGSGIMKEKEDGFYITYWDDNGWRIYEKKLYDLQVIKDQPKFIILESYSHPGTGMGYTNIAILTIENTKGLFENKFKTIWSDVSAVIDNQPGMYNNTTEINTSFRDLDGDEDLEIIREGYERREENYSEETGKFQDVNEEKIYQVLKWDVQTRGFKDQTADWKTYRNEEYGFEIKYPLDFTAKDWADKTPNYDLLVYIGTNTDMDGQVLISILKGVSKFKMPKLAFPSILEEVFIGEGQYKAFKVSSKAIDDYANEEKYIDTFSYSIEHNGHVYEIFYRTGHTGEQNIIDENTFSQMLSTFTLR